jgi:ribonuclease M5
VVFAAADLQAHGLSGAPDAAERRARLGELLGIGYGTAKKFLRRLNTYGVTRAEFDAALARLDPPAHGE